MDGGAWWATVHGVTKSQTRLSDFTHIASPQVNGEARRREILKWNSLAWRFTERVRRKRKTGKRKHPENAMNTVDGGDGKGCTGSWKDSEHQGSRTRTHCRLILFTGFIFPNQTSPRFPMGKFWNSVILIYAIFCSSHRPSHSLIHRTNLWHTQSRSLFDFQGRKARSKGSSSFTKVTQLVCGPVQVSHSPGIPPSSGSLFQRMLPWGGALPCGLTVAGKVTSISLFPIVFVSPDAVCDWAKKTELRKKYIDPSAPVSTNWASPS